MYFFYIFYRFYFFFIFFYYFQFSESFKINNYDSVIGKWKLLYTTNIIFNNENYCELCIKPSLNKNDLYVKIKKYESHGLITFTKVVESSIIENSSDIIDLDYKIDIKCGEECSMIILNSEKYLKSVGIFEFPYFATKYKSEMKPQYLIGWKVDKLLNRLYIYLDKHTYIFERNYYDKFSSREQIITADTFLITNLISLLLGKFLESTLHIK
jgi:hypothetical protein